MKPKLPYWRRWLGPIVILSSWGIGWPGAALFVWLGATTGIRLYYLASAVVYILSWGILALGLWMTGDKMRWGFKAIFKSLRQQDGSDDHSDELPENPS